MVLMKYPKILTGAKPKISIRCKPNIFVPFKSPKILTSKIGHGFFLFVCFFVCVKNMVLVKYPKILTGVLLDILKNCRPKIFVLFKNPKILTSKIGHGFFGVKNMVLMKYPKMVKGAKPKISIRCKPDIFVLFKSPKILTSKSRPLVFWCQKHGSYEIAQDFDRCFT